MSEIEKSISRLEIAKKKVNTHIMGHLKIKWKCV
jgi:hypothetical protein